MRLLEQIKLIDSEYHVVLTLVELEGREPDVIAQYGHWPVDCGGLFLAQDPSVEFTLPPNVRLFPQSFPHKQIFSLQEHADANARAIVYLETLVHRILEARDEALAKNPGVIRSEYVDYPPETEDS